MIPASLKRSQRVRIVSSRPELRGKGATVIGRRDILADVKHGTVTGGPGFAYEILLTGGARIWCNDSQVEAV